MLNSILINKKNDTGAEEDVRQGRDRKEVAKTLLPLTKRVLVSAIVLVVCKARICAT